MIEMAYSCSVLNNIELRIIGNLVMISEELLKIYCELNPSLDKDLGTLIYIVGEEMREVLEKKNHGQ
tara:strand:- start:13320 stop:13520 length:201 start_codon:yes stop_codon:yes gene_type:complete